MAKDETKPLTPATLEADLRALASLQTLKDYQPTKVEYGVERLEQAAKVLLAAEADFARAEAAWDGARDTRVAAQWALHNGVLGARQQVVAQYGDDSTETQSMGLTRKSERARPRRRAKAAQAA